MATPERLPKAAIYQHSQFLRPAMSDDFRVGATVLITPENPMLIQGKSTW